MTDGPINYEAIFNDSYGRVIESRKDGEDLFDTFYRIFLAKSPEIGAKFKGTDMARQKEMLSDSLVHMLNFFVTRTARNNLQELARLHNRHERNIPPRMYDLWLDSLVEAVGTHDTTFNDDVNLAWRVLMAPGVAYMKFRYDH